MSHAATRPAASASGTGSARVMGKTLAARRRRASSIEIVDVNGRMDFGNFQIEPSE
jgi:hypothetical protein